MTEAGSSAVKGIAVKRDWTKGSVVRNLLGLSWPMVLQQVLYQVSLLVEMIWVGRLGIASIAAVGIGTLVFGLVMTGLQGLAMGARATIARYIGTGDTDGANHVARQAFIMGTGYAIVIAIIGFVFTEPILRLFGLNQDVISEGVKFLHVLFAGWVTMSYWSVAFGIMQASGDAVTPMQIQVVSRVIHVILYPFLIFGWWIFPTMGIGGAALTQVLSQSLAALLGVLALLNGRSRLHLSLNNFRIDAGLIWRIMKIGIPSAIMGEQASFGNLVLARFMVPFGNVAVAAHGLVRRVETMITVANGPIGSASGVLAGQNLGARQPGRAKRNGWLATGFVEIIMVTGSIAVLLWAENIIRIFNTEPDLVTLASTFLRIEAVDFLFSGLAIVLQQSISTSGDTFPPMLISLLMIWLVQVPMAFLLPRFTGLGANGIRWGIVAGNLAGAIIYITYFRLGRLQRKKV
ncbi:MAG: MATE family efflux transporter [Chloroflexi bacterium]|nr:MATE family efflux transporter [Chloroflexota bacterium]